MGVERLRAGIGAYERGEYDDAVFNLELSIIQFSEENGDDLWKAHFYLGLSYYHIGANEEANEEFNLIPELFKKEIIQQKKKTKIVKPKEPVISKLDTGLANYEDGKYSEAVIDLQAAVRALAGNEKGKLWNAHFYLGLSRLLMGDTDEARCEFIKAKGTFSNKLPDALMQSPKIVTLFNEANLPQAGNVLQDPATDIEFVFVKGGCYEMGNTIGGGSKDEHPSHKVCVDDFYMGRYEVTNAEFERFITESGYVTTAEIRGTGYGISGKGKDDRGSRDGLSWRHPLWPSDTIDTRKNHPVVQISWDDSQAYIKWLNNKSDRKYRLPTEAEWEYAARSGGKENKYSWGNGAPSGNISDESAKRVYPNWKIWEGYDDGYAYTASVGNFRPNEIGLYDMTGNVWEWCQDTYSTKAYENHRRNNPTYAGNGSYRVLRGGSWILKPGNLRASNRNYNLPDFSGDFIGLRLVRTVE